MEALGRERKERIYQRNLLMMNIIKEREGMEAADEEMEAGQLEEADKSVDVEEVEEDAPSEDPELENSIL